MRNLDRDWQQQASQMLIAPHPPVKVHGRHLLGRMRGGSQAHLVKGDDEFHYVVKFSNNPQGRRTLINELIGSTLLSSLSITTPPVALVYLAPELIESHPHAFVERGNRREPPVAGWHFGSRFPGDPEKQSVYDHLPHSLLIQVENLHEFIGALVFDKWVANVDTRQALFLRAYLKEWRVGQRSHPLRKGILALMIDQGHIFSGPAWKFSDTHICGAYARGDVYAGIRSWNDIELWLQRLNQLPESLFLQVLEHIPPEWIDGVNDATTLFHLLARLVERRRILPHLVGELRRTKPSLFPNWTDNVHVTLPVALEDLPSSTSGRNG